MSVDSDIGKWVRLAQMDYDAAENMVNLHNPVPIEIVCYHAQQSAEKILKAYAIANGEKLIKTHDLSVLLNQCARHSPDFSNHAKSCITLTMYASFSRYPSSVEITEQQMHLALEEAKSILEFTKSRLAEVGYCISEKKKSLAERLEAAREKVAESDSSSPQKSKRKER